MAESFNSILMWLYFVELISESTERHMIFNSTDDTFKDVGMFSDAEWQLLVSRILSKFEAAVLECELLTPYSWLCNSTGGFLIFESMHRRDTYSDTFRCTCPLGSSGFFDFETAEA